MDYSIASFYNEFHNSGSELPIEKLKQQFRFNILNNYISGLTGNFLDIGCGSGDEMKIFKGKKNVFGIDISHTAIKKCSNTFKNFNFQVSDALNLPFSNNFFDCIVCSEVIEHMINKDALVSEIKRVLKTNGHLIISSPNWISSWGLARKISELILSKPITSGGQPIDKWTIPHKLKRRITKKGFKILKSRGIWYLPPMGRGNKQIPYRYIKKYIPLYIPLEMFLEQYFPYFGHMILYDAVLVNNS